MTLTVISRVQIGFTFAALSLLTISTAEVLMHSALLGAHAGVVCGALASMGAVLWLAGQASGGKEPSENPLMGLAEPKYWGLLLALAAILAYSHSTYRRLHKSPATPVAAAIEKEPVPFSFPPLQVQSIIYQGSRSSALVNGKVVMSGDDVANAVVVAIDKDRVTFLFQHQTNVVYLGRGLGR